MTRPDSLATGAAPDGGWASGDFNTDLAWWYPKLVAAGVQTPRTEIVTTDLDLSEESPVWHRNAKREVTSKLIDFILHLDDAARKFGYPVFLRTGYYSGKHHYEKTCFIEAPSRLERHVREIALLSDMVDMLGLPTDVWAVREWLNLTHHLVAYGGLPIGREFRFFVNAAGTVQCWHPYWPLDALMEGDPRWVSRPPTENGIDEALFSIEKYVDRYLNVQSDDEQEILRGMALVAGGVFRGAAFSIDFAWARSATVTHPQWWAIDMAEAARSYHWPDCEFSPLRLLK